jgi:hypothetical protein
MPHLLDLFYLSLQINLRTSKIRKLVKREVKHTCGELYEDLHITQNLLLASISTTQSLLSSDFLTLVELKYIQWLSVLQ